MRRTGVDSSLDAVFREEHGRLLATLVRRYGDLDLAEDVASDAIEAALVHWPVDGVPKAPGAWLLTTARRRAVDRLRRDSTYASKLALLHVDRDRAEYSSPPDVTDAEFPDDRLQMFFTCSHPALGPDDRVALTLRCLAGFTTHEVARAFLVTPTTAGQRITRAKKKIRDARIPFRVPGVDELPHRLPGVLQVVYSIFTEGYAASTGDDLMRTDLADEAIRLGRILRALLPSQRETTGLLALMLLTHARRAARTGPGGAIEMLEEQDRTLWDQAMIDEGTALVVEALSGDTPGPYAVQAAIAALHDEARTPDDVDWPQIVALYGVLSVVAPSPVVSLGRAVAVAMRDGPEVGLALLDDIADEPMLANYFPYAAARGDLLLRSGRNAEAAAEFRRALDLAGSNPERDLMRRRIIDARFAEG
ncbi:hypothetical protein RhoFasB10_01484 [Rhodococcus sp. B10]|nr:hypothetical protein [Rhodococcus sp. B10]